VIHPPPSGACATRHFLTCTLLSRRINDLKYRKYEIDGLTAALVAVVDEARGDAPLREELIAKGSILGTARGMAVKAQFEAAASTAEQQPSM